MLEKFRILYTSRVNAGRGHAKHGNIKGECVIMRVCPEGDSCYIREVERCNKVFMEFHISFSKDFSFQLINKLLKVTEANNISLRDLFDISILLGN